jgi:hypothetical protein
MSETPVDDIVVIIDHPFGTVEVPLRTWMEIGPGPRPFVHPAAARHRVTGELLPLTVVPLAYRNDDESRKLIAAGKIQDPWKK